MILMDEVPTSYDLRSRPILISDRQPLSAMVDECPED